MEGLSRPSRAHVVADAEPHRPPRHLQERATAPPPCQSRQLCNLCRPLPAAPSSKHKHAANLTAWWPGGRMIANPAGAVPAGPRRLDSATTASSTARAPPAPRRVSEWVDGVRYVGAVSRSVPEPGCARDDMNCAGGGETRFETFQFLQIAVADDDNLPAAGGGSHAQSGGDIRVGRAGAQARGGRRGACAP